MSFRFQRRFKELRGVSLYFYVLERVREAVAPAPAVAVDTPVTAPSVDVHPETAAAAGQYSLGINEMHIMRFPSFRSCSLHIGIIPDAVKYHHSMVLIQYIIKISADGWNLRSDFVDQAFFKLSGLPLKSASDLQAPVSPASY